MKTTKKDKGDSLESYLVRIEEAILDAEQVADLLSVSKKIVERELRDGKMKGYKKLNKWFVLKSDLIGYIRDVEED